MNFLLFLRLFFGYFVQILPFAILGLYPFMEQFRFSRKKTAIITLILILSLDSIFSLLGLYFHQVLPSDNTLFRTVNFIFMLSLVPDFLWLSYAVKATSWQKKLFVFSFLLTSAFSLVFLCNILLTWIYMDSPNDGLPYRGISTLVILGVTVLVLPFLLHSLKHGYQPVADSLTKEENGYLSVLSLILFLVLASELIFVDFDNLYNTTSIFFYVTLQLAIFFIYSIFFRMLALSHEKKLVQQDSIHLKHQLEIRDEQYHRFNDSIEHNRRMHHDLKHHMLAIRSFLSDGDTVAAENYLNHCIEMAEEYEITRLCDVPVINWIVSYYQALAKSKDILFTIRISVPPLEKITILDTDFSVLLGNLLENAIAAAEQTTVENRYIRLNITHSGNMLVITVDNSFNGNVKKNGASYLSTKKEHHGIGLSSMEAIAEKYGGGVEFTNSETVFHSSVMLTIS